MLFGTAARKRQQRVVAERMAAVGNRGKRPSQIPIDRDQRRLDPRTRDQLRTPIRRLSRDQRAAGRRARGRERQPAIGRVRDRDGGRRVRGTDPRLLILLRSLVAGVGDRRGRRRRSHDGAPPRAQPARGEAAGAAARRPHHHGELAARRAQLPAGARHGGEGDRAAGRDRVPAGRGRGPPGSRRGGRTGGARRTGGERGFQVGGPRGEHPARGRRQPGRDLGQRVRHAPGAGP